MSEDVFGVANRLAANAKRLYGRDYNVSYWQTGSRKSAYIKSRHSKVVRVSDHDFTCNKERFKAVPSYSADYRKADELAVALAYLGRER